jgi:hypothetical protein
MEASMTYYPDSASNHQARARIARPSRSADMQARYLMVLASIIPALAILAAAASFLLAAG